MVTTDRPRHWRKLRVARRRIAAPDRRKREARFAEVPEVSAPKTLPDLALVEIEPPQDAVALQVPHGLLR
jgi:hypothetical protein